jgi:PAS domain S-box-containing protein
MKLKLFTQAIILVSVPVVFQLVFVFTLAGLLKQAEAETAEEARSRDIIAGADRITKLYQEGGYCLYAYKNTKQPQLKKRGRADYAAMFAELDHLRTLVGDRQDEKGALERVTKEVTKANQFCERFVSDTDRGIDYDSGPLALKSRLTILSVSNELLSELRQFTGLERRSEQQAQSQGPATRRLIWNCLILGVVSNIVLALFLARLFYKSTSSRLNTLVDNTKRLAHGKPLKEKLSGNDEIAVLDTVFHSMAASLAEARRKERAVIDNASDVICTIDANMDFVSVNQAAKEIFGFPQQQLIGKNLANLVSEEDWSAVRAALDDVRDNRKPASFDSRIVRADEMRDIQWSVHWSESESCFFCVAHDVSERKRLEAMKQDFVSMVSHDLRTPLMSVQADIDLLTTAQPEPSPANTMEKLGSAGRNVKYVISLINSLLDLERMTADQLDIHVSLIRLQKVFDQALEAVSPLAQKKQIKLECPGTDAIVMADEDRLVQVLINLISNALKFSGQGTCIKIEVKELSQELEIRVIDQGRGVPKEKLQSIFGRFEQVEHADGTNNSGAGLGLAICKKIIEGHNGVIGVDSSEGSGSAFWIRLPMM